MYLLSICLFQHSKTRVYVLLAFLPGGQRLYIVVNGPLTNRKLIWQELTDVVEIREAWSILKLINLANREIKFQLFGTEDFGIQKVRGTKLVWRIYLEGKDAFWKWCT